MEVHGRSPSSFFVISFRIVVWSISRCTRQISSRAPRNGQARPPSSCTPMRRREETTLSDHVVRQIVTLANKRKTGRVQRNHPLYISSSNPSNFAHRSTPVVELRCPPTHPRVSPRPTSTHPVPPWPPPPEHPSALLCPARPGRSLPSLGPPSCTCRHTARK